MSTPRHVLKWTPGQSGRGFVFEGEVHTWVVDTDSDTPTHADYLDWLGFDHAYELDYTGAHPFIIDPTGLAEWYIDPGSLLRAQVSMADRRIRAGFGQAFGHADALMAAR